MINVLTNDVRRVFLECNPERRVFDNVWTINGILIFKGSCVVFLSSPKLTCFDVSGKLEGETIVSRDFPNLPVILSRMEHLEY